VDLLASEDTVRSKITTEHQSQLINMVKGFMKDLGVAGEGIDKMVDYTSLIHVSGEIPKGKYPLLIFYQGINGSIIENALLCEYLASQGFFVASFPSLGINKRNMEFDAENIESLYKDGQFVKWFLRDKISFDEVYSAGFSLGGGVAFLDVVSNKVVKKGFSFDPSITFGDRKNHYLNTPYYTTNDDPLTYLIFNQYINQRNDFTLLKGQENKDISTVGLVDYGHYDFTAFGLISAQISGFLNSADGVITERNVDILEGGPISKYQHLYQLIAEYLNSKDTTKISESINEWQYVRSYARVQ